MRADTQWQGRTVTDSEFLKYIRTSGTDLTYTEPMKIYDPKTGKPCRRRNVDKSISDIECEWGYERISSLKHLTVNKHHFTRRKSGMLTRYAASRRPTGGPLKIGDMEVQALASSGLSHGLQEFAMRRDKSKVSVCTNCNRQFVLYNYPVDEHQTYLLTQFRSLLREEVLNTFRNSIIDTDVPHNC